MFRLNVGSGADHWLATGHLDVLCLKLKFLRLQCVPFALGLVGLDVACTCSLHGVLPLVAGVYGSAWRCCRVSKLLHHEEKLSSFVPITLRLFAFGW